MSNEKSSVDDVRTRLTITDMIAARNDLQQVIRSLHEMTVPIINTINATTRSLSEVLAMSNASSAMTYVTDVVASLCKKIQVARDNPNSVINFFEYQKN